MPRIARAVASGYPHHITQRGNNRDVVFFDNEDKTQYLILLEKYAEKWNCGVMVYCLMSNHVHLLAKPDREESLYKMMQGITLCYSQYANRRYRRSGRLWESRYHSCIVDKEDYLWAVARYIEQNPVRAGMVKKAEDYAYSSARAHIRGIQNAILKEPLFEAEQRGDYARLLRTGLKEDEMEAIRYHIGSGRPFGSENFVARMEKKLNKALARRPRGRPRTEK